MRTGGDLTRQSALQRYFPEWRRRRVRAGFSNQGRVIFRDLRLHCGYVFAAAAQRYPRWKIAHGNDLLRGLVKKKLLDGSREQVSISIILDKASNKFFNFPFKRLDN